MTPSALPIERLPAHQRPAAHRAIQVQVLDLLVEVMKAANLAQEASLSALQAAPTPETADAIDRLLAALESIPAKARAARNLCEDRRSPRDRSLARIEGPGSRLAPDLQDPARRLARLAAHAARSMETAPATAPTVP